MGRRRKSDEKRKEIHLNSDLSIEMKSCSSSAAQLSLRSFPFFCFHFLSFIERKPRNITVCTTRDNNLT